MLSSSKLISADVGLLSLDISFDIYGIAEQKAVFFSEVLTIPFKQGIGCFYVRGGHFNT